MQDTDRITINIKKIYSLIDKDFDDTQISNLANSFAFLKNDSDLVHAITLSGVCLESISSSVLDLHLLLILEIF